MTEHQPTSSHNTNTGPDSARRTASELQQIIAAEHIPPPDDAPEPPEQTIDHLSLPDYANVPYPDTEPPVSQADVEEAFKQQAEALRQAHIDELTGIPNRLGLDKNLQSLWGVSDSDPHYVPNYQRESPGPHHAIVVRLDMGELKLANDIKPEVGDELLRRFARSLDGFARSTDIVARQGGDDFVLVIPLLDDLTDEGRAAIAESIDRRLKKLFAPEPDPEGPEPDPSLRIKQLRANYEAYTAQRAEYMARLANGQDAGEEPRLANVPMAPLASIGVAMGRIVPEEPGYEPGAPNHNYHALFNQAVVNEKAHKQEMVDKKILNPRPTAIVADESPAPAADHPVEQP